MPELPEVETTRRGIAPLVTGRIITAVVYRAERLRRPLPEAGQLVGQTIGAVHRRAKYLLFEADAGWLVIHLGMTGHLSVVPATTPPGRHDHVDFLLSDGRCLRFNDSRRFGMCLWIEGDPAEHPLFSDLGPEPLTAAFCGAMLHERSRGRSVRVKPFLMDQRTVVGVGNIYASEALFRAGVHPGRRAADLCRGEFERIARAVREVLAEALEAGGTTLRDFMQPDGRAGYFRIRLRVYDRKDKPCPRCGEPIRQRRLGGRSTYFCDVCQPFEEDGP